MTRRETLVLCSAFVTLVSAPVIGVGVAHATRDEMRPVLQRLLKTFEGCIVEKYETPATAGLARRDASTCSRGNACSRGERELAFSHLSALANAGIDANFTDRLQRAMLKDCFQCGKHNQWHTKHVHCTMDCGGNESYFDLFKPQGAVIGPCFETCKAGRDVTDWFGQIAREIAQAFGVVKPVEAADQLGGATVAKNFRTVEKPPDELCTDTTFCANPPCLGKRAADYILAPANMLDWTATRSLRFQLTLNGPLKALAIGAGILGSAIAAPLVGFLAPLVIGGLAGGITAIATAGVPSEAIGLPEGPAITNPRLRNSPMGRNIGASEGRLITPLREAARLADPIASLCKSAEAFAQRRVDMGLAFADLAVTGRRTFAAFRRLAPKDGTIVACLRGSRVAAVRGMAVSAHQAAAAKALDRAYTVARILRIGGWPTRCPERQQLGWIAVSGEDDQPHRPVNVPSAPFAQHDLAVRVNGRHTVNTRYIIAHSTEPAVPPSCKGVLSPSREVPKDTKPTLARDADVLFLVHGMDSRAEEALRLAEALRNVSTSTRKNWTVVSVDLPTSGYADNLDHTSISPIDRLGETKFRFHGKADLELTDLQVFNARGRHEVPVLNFIEDFIVAFVDKLDTLVPLKARLRAVVGGSLGGNMALRLGRRVGAPWLKTFVPWSPAAIWPSYADGGNPGNHLGVAIPVLWGGGDARVRAETPAHRREFFYKAFDWTAGLLNRKPQSEEWYRPTWPCKRSHLLGARVDRHETYDRNFRLWHWRLGAEQIIFSHQGPPLYLQNRKRTLLLCGYDDTGGELCEHTRKVAPKMTNTPGKALFLKNTGHSIHDERPCWLAQHIVEFLGAPVGRCK